MLANPGVDPAGEAGGDGSGFPAEERGPTVLGTPADVPVGSGVDGYPANTPLPVASGLPADDTKPVVVMNESDDLGTPAWDPAKIPWNKGKLAVHFDRHGHEFDAASKGDYTEQAIEFGTRDNDGGIVETTNGPFLYRFDPATNTVFVGTVSGGKITTFYKCDGRGDDLVIEALRVEEKI